MTDPVALLREGLRDRYAFERELGRGGTHLHETATQNLLVVRSTFIHRDFSMTRVSSTLVCAALLAACQSSEPPTSPVADAPALAATVIQSRERVPIVEDAVILNECTGELVQFHFNQLFMIHDLEIVDRAYLIPRARDRSRSPSLRSG